MKRCHRALWSLACLFGVSACQARAESTNSEEREIEALWQLRVPMRDGVQLSATVYKPKLFKAKLPVVTTLTPYTSDRYHETAIAFAKHGYAAVLVDSRGRGNSGGDFDPLRQEATDGYDLIEWLAVQPWSNGKVGMWGGSYGGYAQWATAKELPPHLETIVPTASVFAGGVDFPTEGGMIDPYVIQWLTLTSGVTLNINLFKESPFWTAKYRELYLEHRPFEELDAVVGYRNEKFREWVAHPDYDDFWRGMTPTDEQYQAIDLPILTITGHYDSDQSGALEYYRRHMEHARSLGRSKHYLIIGPWDHGGTRSPKREFAGMTFGEESVVDMTALHKEWFDWALKGKKRPTFLKKRVAYYVTGEEKWRHAFDLTGISAAKRKLYFSSSGNATDVFHSGVLHFDEIRDTPADSYIYDPLDTRPGESEPGDDEDWITNQRYVTALQGNGLVYHTAPLEKDLEITGWPRCELWMELDVPDTDFYLALYEVTKEGKSILLSWDQLRARYRESLSEPKLVVPGEINKYSFDDLFFISRRVAKGSRLRFFIWSPNTIRMQKNYNSGGIVAKETKADARTAHVLLYHNQQYPSFIEVPVVK